MTTTPRRQRSERLCRLLFRSRVFTLRTVSAETMVVIIVSVSLALMVCAVIPIIFYGRCRSGWGHVHTCAHVRTTTSFDAGLWRGNALNESLLSVSKGQSKVRTNNPEVGRRSVVHQIPIFLYLSVCCSSACQRCVLTLQAGCCEHDADVASGCDGASVWRHERVDASRRRLSGAWSQKSPLRRPSASSLCFRINKKMNIYFFSSAWVPSW